LTDIWRTIPSVIKELEQEWLVALASDVCAQFERPTFVNIGVSWGCSMHCLRAGCASARLVGIDVDFQKKSVISPEALRAELVNASRQSYCTDFDGPVHLLFIDGSHKLEDVAADIRWTPKVVEGGVVAFHDYDFPPPPNSYVKQAVDEWLAEEGHLWESITSVKPMKALRRKAL